LGERTPVFHFAEKPGLYSVGLRVVKQYDFTRIFRHSTDEFGKSFSGERARPIQTLIWYPATPSFASVGRLMTVRDYVNLWATETRFDRAKMPSRAAEWLAAMSPSLEIALWSVRNAGEFNGRFPLVIYAPSFSSVSWENADLCEYLASHGYVVVATPSMGAMTRLMTVDLEGINAQSRDISFLIAFARTLSNVDISKVAVAGFSWGGISNLFAAARDPRILALVALDGSLRYWPGMVRKANDVFPEQINVPLLSLAKNEWTLEEQARFLSPEQIDGPNVLNAWRHGDLFDIRMLGMTHRQFSSMAQRNEDFYTDAQDPEFPDRQAADYDREDGVKGYGWLAQYVLQFINAHLKRDPSAVSFLMRSPAQNGVPKHFMALNYRPAAGIPASFGAFRAEIGRLGFGGAQDILVEMQQRNSGFKPTEGAITDWAEELMDAGRAPDAIVLLRLGAQLYPDSSGAHAALARGLQLSGQVQAAIDCFREALKRAPFNAEIKRKIREIESEAIGKLRS
jgi:tetratricopeptide (TPR) repeat protein